MAKNRPEEIDENSFLAAIRGTNQKEEPEEKETGEPVISRQKKKTRGNGYADIYLQSSTEFARLGKSLTIRPEYHDMLSKYLQIVTQNKVSLFSYIDNVLTQHFEQYQDEINRLYKENFKDLF